MSLRYLRCLLTAFALLSTAYSFAQAPAHTVFLIGNTAQAELPAARLQQLRRVLEQHSGLFTVVHLGDLVSNSGLAKKSDTTLAQAGRERADALIALVKGLPQGRIYFLPGDKDWANSGRPGLKAVRRLEKYIEEQLPGQNAFLPSNGCPGPEVVDLAPQLRLVAINSPWFTHPFDRPEAPDTDCKTLTKQEFREQLQDVIDDTKDKNVLVVGHHPVISNGVYGGHQPLSRHLLPPVLGTVYAAYRQNVGTPRDLANPRYQELRRELLNTLQSNPGVVYAAAHDFSLQLTPFQGNYHLVAGSLVESQHVGARGDALFSESAEGFAQLEYATDGTVKATFYTFAGQEAAKPVFTSTLFRSACSPGGDPKIPVNAFVSSCPLAATAPPTVKPDAPFQSVTTLAPGPQYKGSFTKRLFIGPIYRSSWTQPVAVPTLDLSTELGGLRPYGKGGGRQTTALKLIAADSSEYVFRSVDKDVTKILPPELRQSIAADILRDVTATAHPYSAVVAGSLLDKTDILHARPRLFRLPDNQQLGPYREQYAGLLGTLEDRPTDPKPNLPGFGNSKDVTRSFGLFRKLYKDHDNRVDAQALAKARVFDMLIADFGKHEDNWKWAGYKQEGGGTLYRPIPRDRDQSFTQWNGLLTYLANREWAVRSIEGFEEKFGDMKSLNWPAKDLDRFLLQGLSREQWQEAARYIQTQITPAAIDEATGKLPTEIQSLSGQDLNRKLKSRVQQLPSAIDNYYLLLARRVDVLGSNKGEVFVVNRLADGQVHVQMFDRAHDGDSPVGPALFDRTFKPRETEEICLYGFDGRDIFQVTGQARSSILVRIIGGSGKDQVVDESRVSGLRTLTKVYDVPDTSLQLGPEADNRTSTRPDVNAYNREHFDYNTYLPRLTLFYNRNDGFGAGAGVSFTRRGFRKPDYKNLYSFDVQASSNGMRLLTASTRHRHAIGRVDAGAEVSYGSYFPFYNFFGIGNNSEISQERYDNGFYTARYRGYTFNAFLERSFRQRSTLRLGPAYEDYTSSFPENSLLDVIERTPTEPGSTLIRPNTRPQRLLGLKALLDLDFRDRQSFARRGVRLQARHESYRELQGPRSIFGLTQGFAEYYGTTRLGIPVTLVLKGGGAANHGPTADIPFYKLTSLGLRENLRGYYRNRFTGDASLYVNTELRLALGQVRNGFLPFYYGVFGFYDRGRVYYQGSSPGGWHDGYGGGFYIAPVVETLAFSISYQVSPENPLIQFGVGFNIDK
ncbi:metallophosphoesterase [Hymenobacter saemangeumensis]|uniref:Metallophosphoesterase n=1 Tax=Hymenobacter saemangeumensis TaxID=1084522 RepID=A0ABP8I2N0_9BACT